MKLKLMQNAGLLTLLLGMSACATKSAPYTPPSCPQVPPLPASLTQPLNAEQSLSELLLQSGPSATPDKKP